MVKINIVKLIKGDCLDKLKQIEDKSMNLVLIDPPYNISKADWDKWKTIDDYVKFMGQVFLECQRVLKDNGSFYFFHNDFEQMAELQHWIKKNTKFIFKSLITWDKLTNADTVQIGSLAKGYGNLRNYFSGSTSEYCVFYTLTDDDISNNYPLCRKYSKDVLDYIGLNLKQINTRLSNRKAEHFFYWKSTQWGMPTEDTYNELINTFNINNMENYIEYKELEQLFNIERYSFNKPNVKIKGTKLDELKDNLRNITTVWNFDRPKSNYKLGHITPKPVNMIKHIIEVSSNEDDMVLDCFMGSGTCAEACLESKRNFIGIELDSDYFETCKNRTKTYITNNNLQDIHIEMS